MFISFFAKRKNFLTFRGVPKLGCYNEDVMSANLCPHLVSNCELLNDFCI